VELTGDGASIKGYQESGTGTICHPDTSGFIACGNAGCTTVKNPNQATSKINFVHIEGMALTATGASSKVIDMTSIGHSDIENNNITLGTGGTSYGIYGNTSVGDLDGTNTLFKHNNMNPQSSGDTAFISPASTTRSCWNKTPAFCRRQAPPATFWRKTAMGIIPTTTKYTKRLRKLLRRIWTDLLQHYRRHQRHVWTQQPLRRYLQLHSISIRRLGHRHSPSRSVPFHYQCDADQAQRAGHRDGGDR